LNSRPRRRARPDLIMLTDLSKLARRVFRLLA
jgi:hypothetical protein